MKEWITGRNPVFEALRAHRRDFFRLMVASGAEEKGKLAEIVQLAASRRIPIQHVLRSQVDVLGENAQGVALEASGYPFATLYDIFDRSKERDQALFVLVLDQIQNPQNLGALLRTAEAVGVHGVLIPLARSVGVTPAVVTASAGASEHLLVAPVNLAQALAQLKEGGAWVIGLEGSPDAKLAEEVPLTGPLAIVVGSEGEGIRSLVRNSCDFLLRLPMTGQIASLNASVAGSVALYLAYWERNKAPMQKLSKK